MIKKSKTNSIYDFLRKIFQYKRRQRRPTKNINNISQNGIIASRQEKEHVDENGVYQKPFVKKSKFVISDGYNGTAWITHKSDMVIGEALRHDGKFQENDIDKCLKVLSSIGRPLKTNTFIDIGANIGTHSINAAILGFENVFSIEPAPENFKLLKANIIMNDLEDSISTRNVAISKSQGKLLMELSPKNFGDHRVLNSTNLSENFHGEDSWDIIEINVETLDDIADFFEIDFDTSSLIWIDTQGHEGHALSGATKLRRASCPVVIEFWPYGLQRSGGYTLLKDILYEYDRIVNLGASAPERVIDVNIQDLDRMYEEMRSNETNHVSPHTDLLLLK